VAKKTNMLSSDLKVLYTICFSLFYKEEFDLIVHEEIKNERIKIESEVK
jgi:hypothetical protein